MIPNQKHDMTVVFTGESSGIGRHAAAELLRQHPNMHLLILVRGGRGPRLATELAEEQETPTCPRSPAISPH
jgi:NAD(P)-dependent dehydrogenase (short-subunit alcohol dehydrogenase family)